MVEYKKMGRLIRSRRNELNLTQDQLVKMVGFTSQAVSTWENGVRFPGPDAQIALFKALGLNPVELVTGLQIFDENLKERIAAHMNRLDKEVFVAGWCHDEDSNDVYLDLSGCEIVTTDRDGSLSDKWIPYLKYHNLEVPDRSDVPIAMPKSEYNPSRIYINHGFHIFVIPIDILEKIGKPLFFDILKSPDDIDIVLRFSDNEGMFDIPGMIYNGQWKGLVVHGGEFGRELCRTMRIRHARDMLETEPVYDEKNNALFIHLDEAKRVNVSIDNASYLLPGWQYAELLADDDEEFEEDEENEDENE